MLLLNSKSYKEKFLIFIMRVTNDDELWIELNLSNDVSKLTDLTGMELVSYCKPVGGNTPFIATKPALGSIVDPNDVRLTDPKYMGEISLIHSDIITGSNAYWLSDLQTRGDHALLFVQFFYAKDISKDEHGAPTLEMLPPDSK